MILLGTSSLFARESWDVDRGIYHLDVATHKSLVIQVPSDFQFHFCRDDVKFKAAGYQKKSTLPYAEYEYIDIIKVKEQITDVKEWILSYLRAKAPINEEDFEINVLEGSGVIHVEMSYEIKEPHPASWIFDSKTHSLTYATFFLPVNKECLYIIQHKVMVNDILKNPERKEIRKYIEDFFESLHIVLFIAA